MPQFDAHALLAYSTVATAPSPVGTGTSLAVQAGDGALFPAVPFNAVVWPAGAQAFLGNSEIIRVSARATDTFGTIARQQEGSSARAIQVGDQIANIVTPKTLTDIEAGSSGSIAFTADDSMKRVTVIDANVATTSKITFSVRRADTTDAADPGWLYVANIVTIAAGSFDVLIAALDWDSPPGAVVPNETVVLHYHIWS